MGSRYILFIDESGKSTFSDPGSSFLLSGLIIDKDLHTALSHYMISLKEKSDIPLEFGHFLDNQDAVGEIMAESRRDDDETVLSAFLSSTVETTFAEGSRYAGWAKSSRKRINSLTFQNKKGLSFGLEIADLFAWAHFNKKHGRSFPIASAAKARRVDSRIKRADDAMSALYLKRPEDITPGRVMSLAEDRVSEFTKALREFKA